MKIFEIIPVYIFIIYIILINTISCLMYYIDKRLAQRQKRRISEKSLLLVVILGGWIGALLGMYKFRHKTKKIRFTFGVPIICIIELVIICYLCYNNYIII